MGTGREGSERVLEVPHMSERLVVEVYQMSFVRGLAIDESRLPSFEAVKELPAYTSVEVVARTSKELTLYREESVGDYNLLSARQVELNVEFQAGSPLTT